MIRRKKLRQAAVLLSAGMLTMTSGPLTALAANDAAWQYRVDQIKDYMNSPLMQTGQVLAENNKIQYDNRPAVIEDSNKNSVISFGDSDPVRYASSTGSSGGSSGTGNGTGPNSQSKTNQVQKKTTTQMTDLTETYHEDFEVYSESLAGCFFFYSNIGNNGITDQPVYVDLPQNITFTMQKDGVTIPYVSKQTLSEYGTYVLKIIALKEPDTVEENPVCYVGTFNFRIQERPVKPQEPETQAASAQTSSGTTSYSYPNIGQNYQSDIYAAVGNAASQTISNAAADAASQIASGAASQIAGALGVENASGEEGEAETEGAADEENNGFSVGEDAIEQMEEEEKKQQTSDLGTSVAPEQTYDEMTGLYTITYSEMSTMTSSVPNGLLTNNSVTINKDGLGAYTDRVSVLKNGVPYTWPGSDVFEEAGSYVLLIPFTDGTKTFSFRILGTSEAEISEYTVPNNLELTEVSFDGAIKPVSSYIDEHGVTRLHMEQEGLWQLSFSSEEGREYFATLLIDHTAPQFSVSVSGGVAVFSYDSSDVVNIVVNDGTSDTSYDALGELTTPGHYTVTAYDEAGNSTQVSFVLKKKVNPAGFFAAALAAILIAGGIVYFKRTKENMDVK